VAVPLAHALESAREPAPATPPRSGSLPAVQWQVDAALPALLADPALLQALLLQLLAGSLPGIWLGSRLVSRTPERLIRSALSLLLAWAGAKLVLI